MTARRRWYPKAIVADADHPFESALVRLHERLDHQDELTEAILAQTTKTNGRVSKLETLREMTIRTLVNLATALGFILTSGLALWGLLK